jgi:hypothetical protein
MNEAAKANRNVEFGRLLKAGISSVANIEGKTAAAIEDELGGQIGVVGDTVQRYKAGYLPPDPRTIQILAVACVQRGFMSREWLQRFLQTGRYPNADKLLGHLCPLGPTVARPARVYHNLPAPTYSQFVMRPQAYAEVVDGLNQRSAMVLIVGLGGNGKTSIAREVAVRCLQDGGDTPCFDAVVWISDKDRPGTTTLSGVLDEVARTLDYPGLTQLDPDEKRDAVEQLLRRQRVLVVVDNSETVGDGALVAWLLRLPEPSKAIVTSRQYRREFRRSCWPVELRGMTDAEARELIDQRLRVLKIAHLPSGPAQLDPLVAATGGNPKAIEVALGLIKYEHRPFQQVVEDLYAARGELFDDLFTRAWGLLNEAARRLLLSATLFPASASGEALATTADVQGFAFDRALELLTDLALLDVQQLDLNAEARYTLHPLVRAFAAAKLHEQRSFEESALERWVSWYIKLAESVGSCWASIGRLDLLDPEQETVFAVIRWTLQNRRYADTYRLAKGVRYYYYVRGFWDKRLLVDLMHAKAAQNDHDSVEEVKALAYYVQIVSRQNNLAAAERHLPRIRGEVAAPQLPEGVYSTCQQAIALYEMARGDYPAARAAWTRSLRQSDPRVYVATRRWLALCMYRQGERIAARQLFEESLQDAIKHGFKRASTLHRIGLAAISLDEGDLDVAAGLLGDAMAQAQQYRASADVAEAQFLYVRLHTRRGDLPAARAALETAIDLFERTGLRRELDMARAVLERLNGGDPS